MACAASAGAAGRTADWAGETRASGLNIADTGEHTDVYYCTELCWSQRGEAAAA